MTPTEKGKEDNYNKGQLVLHRPTSLPLSLEKYRPKAMEQLGRDKA
jgi:hypothetical protein